MVEPVTGNDAVEKLYCRKRVPVKGNRFSGRYSDGEAMARTPKGY
jgi:hypothetical protein